MSELAGIKSPTVMRVHLTQPVELGEYWLGFLCEIEPDKNKMVKSAIDALEEGVKEVEKDG